MMISYSVAAYAASDIVPAAPDAKPVRGDWAFDARKSSGAS
jgi:hypothetical protein